MKQLLIYERPVQLNRVAHRNHRVVASEGDFRFAAGLNSVPVACVEFARAARDYPIVFAGNSADSVVPAALLGLRSGQNLMVDAEGRWAEGSYIPAFLRRYPFVLAERDAEGSDFTVCLDAAFEGLRDGGEEGTALFDEQGNDSALLTNAMEFLQEYQVHLTRTRSLASALVTHDLLVSKQVNVQTAAGETFSLDGFFVVDEQKLRELKGKALQDLAKSGDLGWIYAHLLSLGNVEWLSRVLDKQSAPVAKH
ncbi:SapC family protein [Stenotrophomonas sp.]|uniref:SapC family protein n=1 Tax=Stenotrophomonas sp. TaxID=69392 RepID=UPI0028AB0A05|nr:SapC family protein [Stenotrophomonas sp.]